MLQQLMEQRWLDAHGVMVRACEEMIEQVGRQTLDRHDVNGDKMERLFMSKSSQYKQLVEEYIDLYGNND